MALKLGKKNYSKITRGMWEYTPFSAAAFS